MKVRLFAVLLAIVVVIAVFVAVRRTGNPSVATPPPAPAAAAGVPARAPSVTIAHQLVTARPANPVVTRPAGRPPRTQAASVRRARAKNEGFLARARRVLFGVGRHRPEPFPQER